MKEKGWIFFGVITSLVISLIFYFLLKNQNILFSDWALIALLAGIVSLGAGIIDLNYSGFIGGRWMTAWAHPLNKKLNKKSTKAETSEVMIKYVSFQGYSAVGAG